MIYFFSELEHYLLSLRFLNPSNFIIVKKKLANGQIIVSSNRVDKEAGPECAALLV